METQSKILKKEFEFKIIHIGLEYKENWGGLVDRWVAIINHHYIDYHTGIGHRKPCAGISQERLIRLKNCEANRQWLINNTRITKPSLDDILFSLISDAAMTEYGFEEWCENLGFNPDSRKDLKTFNLCRENAEKLLDILNDNNMTVSEAERAFADAEY